MSHDLSAYVPWGRPPFADVPLPPFATGAEHRRYLHLLMLYIALIDEETTALSTKALNEALHGGRQLAEPGQLTRMELQTSVTTFFPAPWTPVALARALAEHEHSAPYERDGSWSLGSGPLLHRRTPTGRRLESRTERTRPQIPRTRASRGRRPGAAVDGTLLRLQPVPFFLGVQPRGRHSS
jgi:hypothetical protein